MKVVAHEIVAGTHHDAHPVWLVPAVAALVCGISAVCNAAAADEAASTSPPGFAPSSGALEEIVVTAEKRRESLQTVPSSIAALSASALEARGISGVASLITGDVPSVKVEPFAGNQSILEVGIRGFIDPNGSDITNENPVPIYIDDVYYGRQIATALELNDLERIEILRGPQGTLFGKNAEGGAVRLVSKEPTGNFDVNLTAEGGNFGYKKGIAHIDLPAAGGIAAKLDLLGTDNDGYTNNGDPNQHNYGITQSFGGKLTLLYKPSDAISVEYAGDYTRLRTTEYWNAQLSSTDPYHSVWPNQLTFPKSEPYATFRPYDDQKYWGHRITASVELSDSIQLKSITSYRSDEATVYNTAANSSVVPGPFFSPGYFSTFNCVLGPTICGGLLTGVVPLNVADHRQYSEELQLTGKEANLDWVLGLFYLHEKGAQNESTTFNTVLPNSLGGGVASGFFPLNPTTSELLNPGFGPLNVGGADVTSKSYAAFGQATWRPELFQKKLGFTAGVRVGTDDKEATRPAPGEIFSQVTYANVDGSFTGGLPCPQSPGCSPRIKNTRTSPLAALSYNFTPDVSSYFRFSTGYQAPGLSVGSQTFKYVAASSVNSYELGLKSELLDNSLRVNLAAFYLKWHNPQENVQTVSSSTVEFFSGPDIKVSGAELDLAYAPLAGLTIDGSLTYLHGEQATVFSPFQQPGSAGVVQVPFNIVALPDWAASVSVTYDIARTDYGLWRISAQENGTAPYFAVPNAPEINTYWLLNARLSLADIPVGSDNSRLEVSAWGRNLTDRSYRVFVYETPGTAPGTFNTNAAYGVPRTYGLSVNYRFN